VRFRVPKGAYLDIDRGVRAFVRTCGEAEHGAPILLLHGLGATGALNWAPCFARLSTLGGQVIAVDHRGHGRGPRVGDRFSLVDCADDAGGVLRAFGGRPATVVGYSMGGAVAQLLALRHPELVSGLILSATARDFRGRPADRLRFAAVGALAAATALPPALPPPPAPPPLPGRLRPLGWALSEVRHHEPAAVLSAAAALGRFTSRDWIHQLRQPTVVIVHQRDRLVPARRQHKLADSIPDATAVELDVDHMGVASDRNVYLPALLRAVAQVAPRPLSSTA